MNTNVVACDPGASGGFAWLAWGKPMTAKMPPTDEEKLELFRHMHSAMGGPREWIFVIELVGGYIAPRKGRTDEDDEGGAQPGSTMFTFGENAGLVRGIAMARGATVEVVPPRTWQKIIFEKRQKGQSKDDWKRVLKAAAQRRFPTLKVTKATADALLILAWKCPQIASLGVDAPKPDQRQAGGPRSERAMGVTRVDSPDNGQLGIDSWKGTQFVFRKTKDGLYAIVRKATPNDIATLPSSFTKKL